MVLRTCSVFWSTKSLTMVNLASTELEYLTIEHLKPIDDLLTSLNLADMTKLKMNPAAALVNCQQLRFLDLRFVKTMKEKCKN